MIEVQGDMPAERFNHVHMYHEEPFCSQLWYQKHLNVPMPQGRRGAPPAEPRTEANCKVPRGPDKTWPALDVDGMYRAPQIPLVFGDVSMGGYTRQSDASLVSTRGHLADHVGAQRRRSRRLGREAARRERQVPRTALQARRHARGDDRRPQPRSARAGRSRSHEARNAGAPHRRRTGGLRRPRGRAGGFLRHLDAGSRASAPI